MDSPVAQIKERLSIVDVVSSYVKLEKAGIHFKARCPFHNEKTASFFVSPARGSYHCFGCARGGDIFTFVEEIEGLDFPETLKLLAGRAGVVLEKISSKERGETAEIFYALEEAAKFFEAELRKNTDAIDYLKSRGITGATAKKFRIGYAPDGWRNLAAHLAAKKIPESISEKAGLLIKSEKGADMYDRFRTRVMFPINDAQGRVVAFSGRIYPEPEDKNSGAKYVNSPETPVYNKSSILFGYDKAKQAILRENSCIIVEGQMDLVMAHQAGTENTVAVSGTALTEKHLKLIKRFTDRLILSFDGDEAGLKASLRSVSLALNEGMDVMVVTLPLGKDPADIILSEPDKWKESLKSTRPIIEYYLDALKSRNYEERELKREISKQILPLVSEIPNSIDQAHFIRYISQEADIPESAIREELSKLAKSPPGTFQEESVESFPKREQEELIVKRLLGGYLWQESAEVSKEYERISGESIMKKIGEMEESEKESLILEAEVVHTTKEAWERESKELLLSFEKELLDRKFETLLRDLKKAERDKNAVEGIMILEECQKISHQIQDLKARRHSIFNI